MQLDDPERKQKRKKNLGSKNLGAIPVFGDDKTVHVWFQ